MLKALPAVLRADVVAIGRKREVPTRRIGQDVGISESGLHGSHSVSPDQPLGQVPLRSRTL